MEADSSRDQTMSGRGFLFRLFLIDLEFGSNRQFSLHTSCPS
jgi:hypothetical protein